MAKLDLKKSGGDFPKKQPVLIKDGFYGAVFSGYRPTFTQLNFDKTKTEAYVGLRFLITHDLKERPLPRLTSAMNGFVRQSLYFDPAGAKQSSNLFTFFAAILADEYEPAELYELDPSEYPDLDDLVGKPVMLQIKRGKTDATTGITYLKIEAIHPADESLAEVIEEFMSTAVYAKDEKTGVTYLKSPVPEYEEDEEEPEETVAPAKATSKRGTTKASTPAPAPAAKATSKRGTTKATSKVKEPEPVDDDDSEIPF